MEREQFEKQALEHLDAVYRMAYHLARKPDEAEDIVQEVYLRAMRPATIERFQDNSAEGGGGIRAWLFTITHNVFYTRIKKQKRDPMQVEDFFGEAADGPGPGEAPPQWDGEPVDWEQVDGTLKDAIEELRPEYRDVLMMWGVEGLKYREIAEILDVPIGTVMSRLHRARKMLADRLLADEDAVDRSRPANRPNGGLVMGRSPAFPQRRSGDVAAAGGKYGDFRQLWRNTAFGGTVDPAGVDRPRAGKPCQSPSDPLIQTRWFGRARNEQ